MLLRRDADLEEHQIEEMFEAIEKYPIVNIDMTISSVGGEKTHLDKTRQGSDRQWIRVLRDSEYTISLVMNRKNGFSSKDFGKAFAPKYVNTYIFK